MASLGPGLQNFGQSLEKEEVAPSCSSCVILELVDEDDPENRVFRLELSERTCCPVPGVGTEGMNVVPAGAGCAAGPPLDISELKVVALLLLVLLSDDESTESGGENGMAATQVTAQLWVKTAS